MASVKNYNFIDGRRTSQKYDSMTKYELEIKTIDESVIQLSLPTVQARCEVAFSLQVRSPLHYEAEIGTNTNFGLFSKWQNVLIF